VYVDIVHLNKIVEEIAMSNFNLKRLVVVLGMFVIGVTGFECEQLGFITAHASKMAVGCVILLGLIWVLHINIEEIDWAVEKDRERSSLP